MTDTSTLPKDNIDPEVITAFENGVQKLPAEKLDTFKNELVAATKIKELADFIKDHSKNIDQVEQKIQETYKAAFTFGRENFNVDMKIGAISISTISKQLETGLSEDQKSQLSQFQVLDYAANMVKAGMNPISRHKEGFKTPQVSSDNQQINKGFFEDALLESLNKERPFNEDAINWLKEALGKEDLPQSFARKLTEFSPKQQQALIRAVVSSNQLKDSQFTLITEALRDKPELVKAAEIGNITLNNNQRFTVAEALQVDELARDPKKLKAAQETAFRTQESASKFASGQTGVDSSKGKDAASETGQSSLDSVEEKTKARGPDNNNLFKIVGAVLLGAVALLGLGTWVSRAQSVGNNERQVNSR